MKIHVFFSRILFLPQDSFLPKIQKYYCNNFQVRQTLEDKCGALATMRPFFIP